VEDHEESPSWLPEGAAPAVTTDEAPGAAAASDSDTSADFDPVSYDESGDEEGRRAAPQDSGPPVLDEDQQQWDDLTGAAGNGAEATAGERGGSYGYGYTLGTADPGADPAGDDVSESTGELSATPPYPAEYSRDPITAASPAWSVGGGRASTWAGGHDEAAGWSRGAGETAAWPEQAEEPARPAAAPRPKSAAAGGRRANLVLARLEPWSVMKFSFLISLVAWVVLFVAVALLYYTLSGLGVFASLARTLQSVTSSQGTAGVELSRWTSAPRVLGYTMLIGAVNVVIITALSTIGAMIYNLVTHLGGGIEITLKETD
jgi:hypothetical protein